MPLLKTAGNVLQACLPTAQFPIAMTRDLDSLTFTFPLPFRKWFAVMRLHPGSFFQLTQRAVLRMRFLSPVPGDLAKTWYLALLIPMNITSSSPPLKKESGQLSARGWEVKNLK